MLRVTEAIPRGDWKETAADTAVLGFDDRNRQRGAIATVGGLELLLDLPARHVLRSGDALKLDDGRLIEIVSAPEPLAEIRAETPDQLARLAWHLGGEHRPIQIVNGRLRIRHEPAVVAMVEGLGGKVRAIETAFDPEGGAYLEAQHDQTHAHCDHEHHVHAHHDHGHHDHHGHAHKGHAHAAHDHHEHGPECGHDHKHG